MLSGLSTAPETVPMDVQVDDARAEDEAARVRGSAASHGP
jgi:hypothetical protein